MRAYRCVVHDRNPHVTFASDEDYNYVLDRTDATLRTSRFSAMYDEDSDEDSINTTDHRQVNPSDELSEDEESTKAVT